jgi:hypothetical protein
MTSWTAFGARGPRTESTTPIAPTLINELAALRPARGSARNPAPAQQTLTTLTSELQLPDTAVAAFDGLAETINRVDAPANEVDDRLAILVDVLAAAGRSPSRFCRNLGGILQDQRWEISPVRNELDQTPVDSCGQVGRCECQARRPAPGCGRR